MDEITNGHSLAKLATALAKAQSEMTHAQKDASNPAFRSKYATLSSAIDACRGPLTKHGIAFVQTFGASEPGYVSLTTSLIHESGETICSTLTLQAKDQTPQAFGSAQTYARRYALMALVGIAPDDDDAAEAQAGGAPAPVGRATSPAQPAQAAEAVSDWDGANRRLAMAFGKHFQDRHLVHVIAGRILESKVASLKDLEPEEMGRVLAGFEHADAAQRKAWRAEADGSRPGKPVTKPDMAAERDADFPVDSASEEFEAKLNAM